MGKASGQVNLVKNHSDVRRKRRALLMTDTELKLIAALAIIGLSSQPKIG
jgi:transposase